MNPALDIHRLQFAFTATFHYIFPQLTMGLALLLVILKTLALRTGNEHYDRAARFWARIFGINFALGVVTGIPLEFEFGTNWAIFSRSAGSVIGQTLAMEGIFSFFLESSFLGVLLYGERRLAGSATGRLRSWCGWAPGSPAISSLRPTPGCSTRRATRWVPTASSYWRVFGDCC